MKAIYYYIQQESLSREIAYSTINKISRACAKLDIFPERGLARDFAPYDCRSISIERKYLIFYQIKKNSVEITNIFQAGRDFESDIIGLESSN